MPRGTKRTSNGVGTRWLGADACPRHGHAVPWRAYGWAVASVALCTLLDLGLFAHNVHVANLAMIYLLGILAVALRGDRGAAFLTAILSVLAFDFFFTQPYLTFIAYDSRFYLTFLLMGLVGVVVADLTSRLAEQVETLAKTTTELDRRARELDRAYRELREADRYKDEFLAAVSHELRTPLSTVIGFGRMLADGDAGPLSSEQAAYLDQLLQGADRMNEQVDELIDLSQIQAGKFQLAYSELDYGLLVHDTMEALRPSISAKGLTLVEEVAVPGSVTLDGQRIREVLDHLVENAVKFTPAGGRITLRAWSDGDRIVTEVRDTGIGIPEDVLPGLFQRFHQADMSSTRRVGGLGMGLAISKAIVEAHGGQIGVMSEAERGSRFWFSLPRVPVATGPPTLEAGAFRSRAIGGSSA